MSVAEILYGRTEYGEIVTERYGSRLLGACVVVMRMPPLPPSWIVQLGRLSVSVGPAGAVEAGIDGIAPEHRGRWRIYPRRDGMAVATHLERASR